MSLTSPGSAHGHPLQADPACLSPLERGRGHALQAGLSWPHLAVAAVSPHTLNLVYRSLGLST